MKTFLLIFISVILSNLAWVGLYYGDILPNRTTSTRYLNFKDTPAYAPPIISFNGYSPESDFDAILAGEIWELKYGKYELPNIKWEKTNP